jgi:hypothetical protein
VVAGASGAVDRREWCEDDRSVALTPLVVITVGMIDRSGGRTTDLSLSHHFR